MSKFIGVKLIEAVPMYLVDAEEILGRKIQPGNAEGYLVTYPDGYRSWSPKGVFDKAHIKVGDKNTIEEHNINEFILKYDTTKWGDKTTVVHATLANGFIMTEASSCVDPANFSLSIGESICRDKIQNKLWNMLGFMLQTAVSGVKR